MPADAFVKLTHLACLLCYFHSHTLTEQFPCSSPTYSKTPTVLSRNDNFPPPVKVVRKNTEPWNL
ncbi:MAG: hypothetical protein QOA16_04565, partial [Nitrososphaeraceae archaeon]|nr:hypothetical protein [Nitrososphaeraceae archaeon]